MQLLSQVFSVKMLYRQLITTTLSIYKNFSLGTVTLIYENENGEEFQQETTFETVVNRPIVQLQQTDNTEDEEQKAAKLA